MVDSIYFVCQIGIMLLAFGLLSMLLFGLRFAYHQLRVPPARRRRFLQLVVVGILFWLAILAVLAFGDFFWDTSNSLLRMPFVFIPPLVAILLLLGSRSFARLLRVIPGRWLITVQGFRVLMELLLWLGFLGGFIPAQMTFEWLNYDIIVGVTALFAGYVFFFRGRPRRPEAILWNVFGIILLLNVPIIGLLSAPSPVQVFLAKPDSSFIFNVPFIWIPGFIVPFALAMHLFSLKQLLTMDIGRRQFLAGKNVT
jgi:hypothetical protein